jgi:hypothetical protein
VRILTGGFPGCAKHSKMDLEKSARHARGHHRPQGQGLPPVGAERRALPPARSVQHQIFAVASHSSPGAAKGNYSVPLAIYYRTLRCSARRLQGGRLGSPVRMVRKGPGPVVRETLGPLVYPGFPFAPSDIRSLLRDVPQCIIFAHNE